MKEIIEKLSTYNIFNYLFPGFVFIYLLNITTTYKISFDNIVYELFFAYFIGVVISRIGSNLIESILKIIKFVRFVDYPIYIKTSKTDSKIEILSEVNNMYRTLCSAFFILLVINIIELFPAIRILDNYLDLIIIFLILILFLFSYRKQTKMIKDRADNAEINISNNDNDQK